MLCEEEVLVLPEDELPSSEQTPDVERQGQTKVSGVKTACFFRSVGFWFSRMDGWVQCGFFIWRLPRIDHAYGGMGMCTAWIGGGAIY